LAEQCKSHGQYIPVDVRHITVGPVELLLKVQSIGRDGGSGSKGCG